MKPHIVDTNIIFIIDMLYFFNFKVIGHGVFSENIPKYMIPSQNVLSDEFVLS